MKSSVKQPISTLGKLSLILIATTFIAWLFVNNAQNCLARDFVEKTPPAVCWRTTNDYESTIGTSQSVFLTLLFLAIVCSSVTITKRRIRLSNNSQAENKKIAIFITLLSTLLLLFIITVYSIYLKTTFNNNNYYLNTISNAVIIVGSPIWLACAAAAVTYWSKVIDPRAAK